MSEDNSRICRRSTFIHAVQCQIKGISTSPVRYALKVRSANRSGRDFDNDVVGIDELRHWHRANLDLERALPHDSLHFLGLCSRHIFLRQSLGFSDRKSDLVEPYNKGEHCGAGVKRSGEGGS